MGISLILKTTLYYLNWMCNLILMFRSGFRMVLFSIFNHLYCMFPDWHLRCRNHFLKRLSFCFLPWLQLPSTRHFVLLYERVYHLFIKSCFKRSSKRHLQILLDPTANMLIESSERSQIDYLLLFFFILKWNYSLGRPSFNHCLCYYCKFIVVILVKVLRKHLFAE